MPVKPNIVFSGEKLPKSFVETLELIDAQSEDVDLCIVLGTALPVSPFNIAPTMLREDAPKVLFNTRNKEGNAGQYFSEPWNNKLFVRGKCDETIRKLVEDCGWTDEFEAILPDIHKKSSINKAMIQTQKDEIESLTEEVKGLKMEITETSKVQEEVTTEDVIMEQADKAACKMCEIIPAHAICPTCQYNKRE